MTTMPQLNVMDHNCLFKKEEFKQLFENKKEFENAPSQKELDEQLAYTKTEAYQEKNFARKHLVINPAKACQPLGAILVAAGFEGCLPYIHGSQGCAAYFRSHFNRHFKEPFNAVSDSMTEDAAVFGGQKNLEVGLKNAYDVYKPKMMALCTTCMAEVIGDDLNAFIENAKSDLKIPSDFPLPFAHTPSFVGTHVTGYDNMLRGILNYFTKDIELEEDKTDKINIIPGFDGYSPANIPEIKRMLDVMNVKYAVLGDNADILNTPLDGNYKITGGGTTIEEVKAAKNSKATFALLPDSVEKVTTTLMKNDWQQPLEKITPLGLSGTDNWLMKVKEVTGKDIPDILNIERGRALDAMADSSYYLHGKRFAIFGDASYVEALIDFYMEMGAEPVHIVVTGGKKKWGRKLQAKLDETEFGKEATVHYGKDLWHLRSLMFTNPIDFLVGSTHGKTLSRELDVPLIRIGFPILDRHHMHRFPTFGYRGLINILTLSVNTLLDDMDRKSEDFNFDLVR